MDELTTYCDMLVQPAATYYKEKLNNIDGDHYKIKQCARVAHLFNPYFVKEKSIAALALLSDDLTLFGCGYDSIFTGAFITNLKREIPALIQEARKEFSWDSVGSSKQYQTRLMKRGKRSKLDNEDITGNNWMKDPEEKASRLQEW